jgi:hypothetical protein
MNGTFMSLVVIEAVLTGAAIVMILYRGMLDMKEEDHIVLDNAEAHLVREQDEIRHKVNVISRYLRVVAVLWTVGLIAMLGVWLGQGLGVL